MTREEAKAYFEECNDGIITASKDENVYDYEKQEIMSVFMKRTYEANAWAISALNESDNEGEWIEDENFLVDDDGRSVVRCSKCGEYHGYVRTSFCPNCGAKMKGE